MISGQKVISLQGFGGETQKYSPPLERTRQIILKYGWNTTSYQILNPGIRRWFSAAGDALVGFVAAVGVRVADCRKKLNQDSNLTRL